MNALSVTRRLGAVTLLALELVLAPGAARATITPDAKAVIDRYLEVTGGAASLVAEQSSHTMGRLSAFGMTGTVEAWSTRPDKGASVTSIGPFTLREGYDGTTAWRVDQNGKFSRRDGKDLEDAKASVFFENDQWLMPDQGGADIALTGIEKDSSNTYQVLEVKPPVGRVRQFWFDRKTGLLDRMVQKDDQRTVISRFSEYAPLGGRLRARQTLVSVVGMPLNDARVTVDSISVNLDVDLAHFAPPDQETADVRFRSPGSPVRLPFAYSARHVWLRALVNDGNVEDFLLDTGASITVIDSGYAANHGLKTEGQIQVQGAGSQGGASFAQVDSIRLDAGSNGVVLTGQKVAVLSLNPYLEPFFWRPVAGVLGYDFISRFVMEVDYDTGTLTLHAPKSFQYAGRGTPVPMTMAGNIPVVKAKLDDTYEGEFRLDVGSGSTVDLHGPFVKQHDLVAKAGKTLPVIGGGFGGTFTSHLTRMKKMEIGPYSWADPLVSFSGAETGGLSSEDYQGNIGNQILERFKCTFDYDRRLVYLEPGARYAKADRFSLAGMQLARLEGKTRAMQVLPGSAAEAAGVRTGDQILSVDKKPIESWTFDTLNHLFEDGPLGRKVPVEIVRDGKKKKVTMVLKSLI